MDFLYTGADFSSPAFASLVSREPGDGGLNIGGLVFAERLAAFAERPVAELIEELSSKKSPAAQNVGGPAIVSLIHTAQVMPASTVRFFGLLGNDEAGMTIAETIDLTPVDSSNVTITRGATPATHVFSDPNYQNGEGERLFVNQLGVANDDEAGELPARFCQADIVQFGGTALLPPLHSRLPDYLRRAKAAGAFTVVNTVYDFMAESRHPGGRWTLGSDESYPAVDLMITDLEESRRLTNCEHAADAIRWFLERGVGAAIVTSGADPVWFAGRASDAQTAGTAADLQEPKSLPVFSRFRSLHREECAAGDTTGCGDNFCGGVVAEIARFLDRGEAPKQTYSLEAAVRSGIAAGALCLTYVGGTMLERHTGEKRARVANVREQYGAEEH